MYGVDLFLVLPNLTPVEKFQAKIAKEIFCVGGSDRQKMQLENV